MLYLGILLVASEQLVMANDLVKILRLPKNVKHSVKRARIAKSALVAGVNRLVRCAVVVVRLGCRHLAWLSAFTDCLITTSPNPSIPLNSRFLTP